MSIGGLFISGLGTSGVFPCRYYWRVQGARYERRFNHPVADIVGRSVPRRTPCVFSDLYGGTTK